MAITQSDVKNINLAQPRVAPAKRPKFSAGPWVVNILLALICLIWTIPTLGLLLSSFRTRDDIQTSGWWTVFPHQEYAMVRQEQLTAGLPLDQPISVLGTTLSDDQLRAGYILPSGQKLKWFNRRQRIVDVQEQKWLANSSFNLNNYQNVLVGQQFTFAAANAT